MKNLLSKIKIWLEDKSLFFLTLISAVIFFVAIIFSVTSSAADEPSEGGQSSAPTDLTGTTWSLQSGWSVTGNYGTFSVDYLWTSSNGSSSTCDVLYLGKNYQLQSSSNTIVVSSLNSVKAVLIPSNDWTSTFTFSGGNDISNPNLISWLMNNAVWQNPPEPDPTPTYTIQPNYYQIKLQPDMIPDDVGFYEYGGQFIYEGETYRSLRFARVSSHLTNIYLYDDDGNQIVIKGQTASNDGWFSGRNITLVSPITTENEDAYIYFTENLSATEQSPFDLVTYMISGFFKALDNFYLFFDFTLLDYIYVMCGLLAAVWFLKLLAGG